MQALLVTIFSQFDLRTIIKRPINVIIARVFYHTYNHRDAYYPLHYYTFDFFFSPSISFKRHNLRSTDRPANRPSISKVFSTTGCIGIYYITVVRACLKGPSAMVHSPTSGYRYDTHTHIHTHVHVYTMYYIFFSHHIEAF